MNGDDLFEEYLEAKHGAGGPDAERFENPDSEVHTSQLGDCRRKYKWDRERGSPAEASPYFELGRIFETLYGAALAWRHGDLDRSDLAEHKPWELPGLTPAVEQDVNIEVAIDEDTRIVGEADWVVYREGMLDEVGMHGGYDLVELAAGDLSDGERRVTFDDGHQLKLEPGEETAVERVVETKTIKDLSILSGSPKDSHLHQLWGYMWALNAPGRWAYMVRDDLTLAHFDEPQSSPLEMEVELSARRKREDLASDGTAPADPTSEWECYYCPFRSECGDALR